MQPSRSSTVTTAFGVPGESYLSVLDGWMKKAKANGHVLDAANANIDTDMLSQLRLTLPSKYVQSMKRKLQYLAEYNLAENYARQIERRGRAVDQCHRRGATQGRQHAEPAGVGDRGDHVTAMAEGEEREIDAELFADPGSHPVSSATST